MYNKPEAMKFSLNNDTRALIQRSTGLNRAQQQSVPLSEIHENGSSEGRNCYRIKKLRDLKPRGSVYLQMGRVLSLKTVKSYLKRI